jgi:hypothetical protein
MARLDKENKFLKSKDLPSEDFSVKKLVLNFFDIDSSTNLRLAGSLLSVRPTKTNEPLKRMQRMIGSCREDSFPIHQ